MEQERFAFLGQMIGGLAHNLKTPIMGISGCISAADTLIDECLDSLDDPNVNQDDYREIYGEMRDWFQKIMESTAYMSDIITAIKGQATTVSASNTSLFTVDELIKRTTLLMRHELLSSGCTLTTEYKNPANITLHGDINNLVQVLGNLVTNAIYAQKQVGGGCITIGVEQEDGSIKIYVRDTGPGIPPSVRHRLFREMATSKGAQGTGLGLYICRNLVDLLGGTISCHSKPGHGSTFIVSLEYDLATPEQIRNQNRRNSTIEGRMLYGKNILVAEDNTLNAEVIMKILETRGIHAELARDGEEAVQMYKSCGAYHYQAILMDVMMPIMDGLEAAKEIRACNLEDSKSIPIIGLSADVDPANERNCLAAGMSCCLGKPINTGKLFSALFREIEKSEEM
jgi:CheY-like chemotaxis protein